MRRIAASLCIAIASCFAVFSTGCNEDTILDSSVTPGYDSLLYDFFDSSVLARSVYFDSVVTSTTISGVSIYHGLGVISNDPYFGKTHAGIYMQIVPALNFSVAGSDVDSAVLILPYSGFTFGDTSGFGTQQFRVYKLNEELKKDSSYYAFTKKNTGTLYGEASVVISDLRDSVNVDGGNKAPHLRIKLNDAFITDLTSALASDSTYAAFLSAFNGLYIAPADTSSASAGDAIPYFRLDGPNNAYGQANVQLYYNDTQRATLRFDPANAAHYNYIARNYSGKPAELKLSSSASDTGDVIFQNGPGASIIITIPYVQTLPLTVYNKAALTITSVTETEDPKYQLPSQLFPVGLNDDGTTYTIQDRLPLSTSDGLTIIDGRRKSITIGGLTFSQYVINFPRELQKAKVEGKTQLRFRLIGTTTFPGAYRLVAHGQAGTEAIRMRLSVIYSKNIQ